VEDALSDGDALADAGENLFSQGLERFADVSAQHGVLDYSAGNKGDERFLVAAPAWASLNRSTAFLLAITSRGDGFVEGRGRGLLQCGPFDQFVGDIGGDGGFAHPALLLDHGDYGHRCLFRHKTSLTECRIYGFPVFRKRKAARYTARKVGG